MQVVYFTAQSAAKEYKRVRILLVGVFGLGAILEKLSNARTISSLGTRLLHIRLYILFFIALLLLLLSLEIFSQKQKLTLYQVPANNVSSTASVNGQSVTIHGATNYSHVYSVGNSTVKVNIDSHQSSTGNSVVTSKSSVMVNTN